MCPGSREDGDIQGTGISSELPEVSGAAGLDPQGLVNHVEGHGCGWGQQGPLVLFRTD